MSDATKPTASPASPNSSLRQRIHNACVRKSLPDLADALRSVKGRAQLHLPGLEHGSPATRPLMWAVKANWPEGAAAMLRAGADPDGSDGGINPLLSCIQWNCASIARMLLEAGTRLDATDKDGRNAFHLSASFAADTLRALSAARSRWPDLEQVDNDGFTPLAWAAIGDNPDAIDILIKEGADPHHVLLDGATALTWAATKRSAKALERLIAHGADPHHEDKQASNPLMRAVSQGHPDIAEILLKAGTDPRRQTKWGKSAVDIAKEAAMRFGDWGGCAAVLERARTLDLRESLADELPNGASSGPAPFL